MSPDILTFLRFADIFKRVLLRRMSHVLITVIQKGKLQHIIFQDIISDNFDVHVYENKARCC